MRPPAVQLVSNSTGAVILHVEVMSDFHDTPTCGPSYRAEGADVENGPIALPCYAELWAVVCAGYGIRKIMYGPRSIRISKRGGSMWMLVRKLGITLGCIQKVSHPIAYNSTTSTNVCYQAGRRNWLTVLRSPLTVLPMLLADIFAILPRTVSIEPDVRKKFSFGSQMRFDECAEIIYRKKIGDV
jgi:hypothetical protein